MGFYSTETAKSSLDDTWATPRDFFNTVNKEFNFSLDAAALQSSTLVPNNWFGPDHPDIARQDAFFRNWSQDSQQKPIWLNPPYGRTIKQWIAKAEAEFEGGGQPLCFQFQLVLILLGGMTTALSMKFALFVGA